MSLCCRWDNRSGQQLAVLEGHSKLQGLDVAAAAATMK
jgi:hypothetical protein